MSTSHQYHPAGDLETLWTEFRFQINADPHVEIRTTWGRVLQLGDRVPVDALYPWLTDVRRLVAGVRRSIESTPAVPAATILKQYGHVETVLCEWRLNRGAMDFINSMTEPVADALHTAAHTLRHSAAVEAASREQVASVEAHIEALARRIDSDDALTPEVRRVLFLCLERMRYAIARHRIAGDQAFVDAWKECTGEIAFVGKDAFSEVDGELLVDFGGLMRELKALGVSATPAGLLMLASHINTSVDIVQHAPDLLRFLGFVS